MRSGIAAVCPHPRKRAKWGVPGQPLHRRLGTNRCSLASVPDLWWVRICRPERRILGSQLTHGCPTPGATIWLYWTNRWRVGREYLESYTTHGTRRRLRRRDRWHSRPKYLVRALVPLPPTRLAAEPVTRDRAAVGPAVHLSALTPAGPLASLIDLPSCTL